MLDQAVRLARERDEVEIEGWALACYVVVAAFDGDLDGVVGKCRQSVEIAERLGSAISQQKGYLFLGRALVLNGQYEEGASLLEQSLAIARARRTGLEDEALNLAMLAAAHLGLGRLAPALAFAREATGTAQRRGTALTEIVAQIVLARVLAEQKGLDGAAEIRRVLERAEALVDETTARNWQPCVHIERARLAGFEENVAARARELREARRLFEIMPAPIRVREVDQLLAAVS
jgi:tetratricopeptide (TPR) repeat protein